jgi:hypothetical protein
VKLRQTTGRNSRSHTRIGTSSMLFADQFWFLCVFFAKQRGPQSKISVKILLLLFVDQSQLFVCLGRQAAGSNWSALVSFPGSTGYRLQFQPPAYRRQVAAYAGGFPAYRFPRGKRIRSLHWALFGAPLGAGPSIPGCQGGLLTSG